MRKLRLIAVPLVVVVGLVCTGAAQRRVDALRNVSFDQELLYLPNEKLLNYFTGGMSSVVADFLWLQCIQYTSEQFRGEGKFVWLDHMCRTITRLDPHFTGAYRYGAIFLAGMKADDDASIELLKRGIPLNPDRWELPYEAALVYLLNRKDEAGSSERAAKYLAMAAATETAPEFVLEFAENLQRMHNLYDVERAMWSEVLKNSDEDFMGDLAKRKLMLLDLREICTELTERAAAGTVMLPDEDPLGGTFFIDEEGVVQNTTLLDEDVARRLNRLRTGIQRFQEKYDRWPETLDELLEKKCVPFLPKHPYPDRSWRYDAGTGEVEA